VEGKKDPEAAPAEIVTAQTTKTNGSSLGGALTLLLGLTAVVVILAGMKVASGIVNPVLLSLIVTLAVAPILGWLMRHGVPSWAGVTIIIVGLFVAGLILIVIMGASLSQLDTKLPVYQESLNNLITDVETTLNGWGIDTSTFDISSVLTGERILDISRSILGAIIGALSNVFVMLFVIIFMLFEAINFPPKIKPANGMSRFFQGALSFDSDVRGYISIKVWLGLLQSIVVGIIYLIFGTDFALLWAVIYFFLSFVPNIGFILALAPPAILTLLEQGWWQAFALVIAVIVVNTAIDNGLGPRLMGKGLDLSPLVVFLSLMLWGFVLGPIGALLSVPLTILVRRLFLEQYDQTIPLARALGSTVDSK
jgi:AI-2 transport protein TqsA